MTRPTKFYPRKEWKARLPRTAPPIGHAHIVFAIKYSSGFRTEELSTISTEQVAAINAILRRQSVTYIIPE